MYQSTHLLFAVLVVVYHFRQLCVAHLRGSIPGRRYRRFGFHMLAAICRPDCIRSVRILSAHSLWQQHLIRDSFLCSIRGQLNSYIQIACYTGILVGFIGGSYLPFNVNPLVMILLPIVFLLSFWWFPESPQYLLLTKRPIEAEKSLRFYRNVQATDDDDHHNKQLQQELDKFTAIARQNASSPSLTVSDFRESTIGRRYRRDPLRIPSVFQ